MEGDTYTCRSGWIMLTKLLVLQGIRSTMTANGQPYQRIVTAVGLAELAHSVGCHVSAPAWTTTNGGLGVGKTHHCAKPDGFSAILDQGPPCNTFCWLGGSRIVEPHCSYKRSLRRFPKLQTDAIILEWVACFLDERIATDILEHLDDEMTHLLEDNVDFALINPPPH